DATPPTAALFSAAPPAPGLGTWDFQVRYQDNVAINALTLDGNDVRVTGPNGFNQLAALVSVTTLPTIGSERIATYRVTAPGGYWDGIDDGSYTISLEANQVRDTASNAAVAGTLGTIVASSPHLISQAGGTVAFVGSSSNDAMTFDADS